MSLRMGVFCTCGGRFSFARMNYLILAFSFSSLFIFLYISMRCSMVSSITLFGSSSLTEW